MDRVNPLVEPLISDSLPEYLEWPVVAVDPEHLSAAEARQLYRDISPAASRIEDPGTLEPGQQPEGFRREREALGARLLEILV